MRLSGRSAARWLLSWLDHVQHSHSPAGACWSRPPAARTGWAGRELARTSHPSAGERRGRRRPRALYVARTWTQTPGNLNMYIMAMPGKRMATWRAAKGPGSSVRSAVAGLAAVWGGQAAAGSPAGEPPHIPLCCLRVPAAGEQAAVSSLATARPPGQDPAAGPVRRPRQRSRPSRRSEPAAGPVREPLAQPLPRCTR